MINRARQVVVMLFLSALAASCAQGATVLPWKGDAGLGNAPMCGNGKLEGTELCECEAGAKESCLVHDKTCGDLAAGSTGPLFCVPSMCVYDDTMCHAQGTAGSTAGSTAGGTAGSTAGGTAGSTAGNGG